MSELTWSELTWQDMQRVLMDSLRLIHYPVAVKFLNSQAQVEEFRDKAEECYTPVKPLTFCQWELAARMKGLTLLGTADRLGCRNALCTFGWKPVDEQEVRDHLKYARDWAQAERFVRSKPRLPEGALLAVGLSPLGRAPLPPDSVHFYCDNLQAHHLAVDYMAALDVHPLQCEMTVSSAACGGNVGAYLNKTANIRPPCSGAYNSGKTERGETNVFIPGEHLAATVGRLLSRLKGSGGASVTREGDPFPGADVCKNCPLIVFRKTKAAGPGPAD